MPDTKFVTIKRAVLLMCYAALVVPQSDAATISLDFAAAISEISLFECQEPAPGGLCNSSTQTFVAGSDFFSGLNVDLSDVINGTFVYATEGPFDISPLGDAANYRHNVIGFDVEMGEIALPSSALPSPSMGSNLTINNDSSAGDGMVAQRLLENDEWVVFASLVLFDFDGQLYDDFTIPAAFSLGDYDSASFLISFANQVSLDQLIVTGNLTALTTTAVPLPGGLILLLGAVPALVTVARRR